VPKKNLLKGFPLAMQKLEWDEEQDPVPRAGNCTATWTASPRGYFRGQQRHFPRLDFIAQLTLHIPPQGKHLLRRYGLYSSLGRQRGDPVNRSRDAIKWHIGYYRPFHRCEEIHVKSGRC
jgi:hypothetical protein